jgi:predicted enzyme related to lactoylglutathione lyase
MAPSTTRGHFLWHELMTTDTKSAANFFGKVVGWKTKPWTDTYTMFMTGARPMGGLMVIPDDAKKMGAPPKWLSYIGTPDVDETARQAASLGATILKQPTDIPNVGRFAVIQDPQGATFAAFKALQEMPSDPKPGVGDFSWHELATNDWRSALAFYKNLFGWEETESMDMGAMGTYQMYGWKGRTLGGIFNKPPQQPGPSAWLAYINVADAAKAVATIRKHGGQVLNGPTEVPGGDVIAQGLDPQGAPFAVHSRKPAAKAAGARPKAEKKAAKKTAPRKAARKKAAPKKAAKKKAAKKAARKTSARKSAKNRTKKRGRR